MIVVDTSVLIEGLSRGGEMRVEFRAAIAAGHRILLPSLVLLEWLRGPRVPAELSLQEALLPAARALPFGAEDAAIAADLYRLLPGARGREIDLAIAATAISRRARLWTLNRRDFDDVPQLLLVGRD